ncbi:MAG: hypothetical protein LQ346_000320 [Caloplaca aetnensis]|nr:MAG: hypothetical protein LQ346_000320 [Caloplaca aetnensis]
MEQSGNAVPLEDRPKRHNLPYRTSMAGSMYYSGASSTPKASRTDSIGGKRSHEETGTTGKGTKREMNSFKPPSMVTANNQARKKPARLGLRLCIPPSELTTLPIEKDHLSPDSALEDRQALEFAHLDPERAGAKNPKPGQFYTFSDRSIILSEQMTGRTNQFETSASSKPSGRIRARTTKGNRKVNLSDELALFSITSQDETLSAFDARMSATSVKAVSALRSGEKNSSVHDWAHEEHRDLATHLTPTCLETARRLGRN